MAYGRDGLLCISVFLTFVPNVCGLCADNSFTNVGKVLTKSSFRYVPNSSVFSCASECVMHAVCQSFNLHLATKTCYLNYKTSSDISNLEEDVSFLQSDIDIWPKTVAGPCSGHTCSKQTRCVVQRNHVSCKPVAFMNVEQDLSAYYELESTRLTWPMAKEDCEGRGGYLAIVENEIENSFLNNILQANGLPNSLVWFGATDEVVEETWIWVDGAPVVYSSWLLGQPNNPGEQDCAGIIAAQGWKSNPCSYTYRFLCEMKI